MREPWERTCDWLENLQIFLEKKEAKHRKKVNSNILQCNQYGVKTRKLLENAKCPLSGEKGVQTEIHNIKLLSITCFPAISIFSCLSLRLCELTKGSVAQLP